MDKNFGYYALITRVFVFLFKKEFCWDGSSYRVSRNGTVTNFYKKVKIWCNIFGRNLMKKGKGNMLINLFMIIGILCLLYFFMYALFADLTNVFTYFWLVIGLGCILVKPIHRYMMTKQIVIPTGLKWVGGILIIVMLFLFIVTECVIIGYGSKEPQAGAEYILVLGAQVKGKKLTYALQARLDTAYDYAVNNPDSIVILSGGQGPGEDITEACAMAEYLKTKGLDESRLVLEDESTNTYENIEYSKKFMKSEDATVVLVTNHFHVFRGVGVAKKQGLINTEGLGAPTKWYTIPNQYMREAFAVIKYKLYGQI